MIFVAHPPVKGPQAAIFEIVDHKGTRYLRDGVIVLPESVGVFTAGNDALMRAALAVSHTTYRNTIERFLADETLMGMIPKSFAFPPYKSTSEATNLRRLKRVKENLRLLGVGSSQSVQRDVEGIEVELHEAIISMSTKAWTPWIIAEDQVFERPHLYDQWRAIQNWTSWNGLTWAERWMTIHRGRSTHDKDAEGKKLADKCRRIGLR